MPKKCAPKQKKSKGDVSSTARLTDEEAKKGHNENQKEMDLLWCRACQLSDSCEFRRKRDIVQAMTDDRLVRGKYCMGCLSEEKPESALFVCARCRLYHYCSKLCQGKDYKMHKHDCSELAKFKKRLSIVEEKLFSTFGGPCSFDQTEMEVYMNRCGDIYVDPLYKFPTDWEGMSQRYACEAYFVGRQMMIIAVQRGLASVFEEALKNIMPLLKLATNNYKIKFVTILLHLALDRTREAYALVKWWITDMKQEDPWCIEANMYEDPWQVIEKMTEDELESRKEPIRWHKHLNCYDYFQTAQSLMLALIKLHIVGSYEAGLTANENMVEAFASAERGSAIATIAKCPHIMERIKTYLTGHDSAKMGPLERQQHHLAKCLDIVHSHNNFILPAILNPKQLMKGDMRLLTEENSPTKARVILEVGLPLILRIPGARKKLEARYGEKPDYMPEWDMNDFATIFHEEMLNRVMGYF